MTTAVSTAGNLTDDVDLYGYAVLQATSASPTAPNLNPNAPG